MNLVFLFFLEIALQHVSMFIRSTNNTYQIVEQIADLGWRYNKSYFSATKVGAPKDDRYLLSWVWKRIASQVQSVNAFLFQCHYGLDKAFGEKDTNNCLKLLKNIAVRIFFLILYKIYINFVASIDRSNR